MGPLQWKTFEPVPITPEAVEQILQEMRQPYELFLQLAGTLAEQDVRQRMPRFARRFRELYLEHEHQLRLGPLISGLSREIMFARGEEDGGLEYVRNLDFWRSLIESPTLLLEFLTVLADWTESWYLACTYLQGFHELLERNMRTRMGQAMAISYSLKIPFDEVEIPDKYSTSLPAIKRSR